MAIAVDGSSPARWSGSPASSASITSGSFTAPANSLLVVCFNGDLGAADGYTYTVTDSGGLTWTRQVERTAAETTSGGESAIWTAATSSSVSRTVAVNHTAGTTRFISAYAYVLTGVDVGGTPVDTVTASNEGGSLTNSINTTSVTPGATGLLLVNDTDFTQAGVFQASSDLTQETASGSGIAVCSGYRTCTVSVGVTGNLNAAGTGAVQHKWCQVVVRQATGVTANPLLGTLGLAGVAPSLVLTVTLGVGTLAVAGPAPTVTIGAGALTVSPAAGLLGLAGPAPTVSVGTVLSPALGTLALTGQTPTRTANTIATPAPGALGLSGLAPTRSEGVVRSPAPGALVLSGLTPVRSEGIGRSPASGALVLQGLTPVRSEGIGRGPAPGTLTLAGQAPRLGTVVGVPAGTLVVIGQAPSLPVTGSIVVDTGTLVLLGQTPTLNRTYLGTPAAGALGLQGLAPTLGVGIVRTPAAGAVTLTGLAPTITATTSLTLTPAAGALVLTGLAPTVSVSGGNVVIPPDDGILVISGPVPRVIITAPLGPPVAVGTLIRRVRRLPHLSANQVRQFFSRFQLDVQAGVGLRTGLGSDPKICLRWSDDGGHQWSSEHIVTAGKLGDYGHRAIWRRLGHSRDRVFEVSVSDPVAWRLLDAYLDVTVGSS